MPLEGGERGIILGEIFSDRPVKSLSLKLVIMNQTPPHPVPQRIKLWEPTPGVVAGADTDSDPTEPTLDIYLPAGKGNPTVGVVVLPGGGYGGLSTDWEGRQVAALFNASQVAAFVVRYRHAPRYRYPVPLHDAQRALRIVRSRAAEFHLAPDQIGIMGFSAGGHLASLVSTRFNGDDPSSADPIDRCSSRPDFAILIYPVITFSNEPYIHGVSRSNLIGDDLSLRTELSSELNVKQDTPPVFLVHGGKDEVVPAQTSALFYLACLEAGVPVEAHFYQQGIHGLPEPTLQGWRTLLINWMKRNGWL